MLPRTQCPFCVSTWTLEKPALDYIHINGKRMTDSPSGDGRLSASFARAARVPFLTTTFYLSAYASGS